MRGAQGRFPEAPAAPSFKLQPWAWNLWPSEDLINSRCLFPRKPAHISLPSGPKRPGWERDRGRWGTADPEDLSGGRSPGSAPAGPGKNVKAGEAERESRCTRPAGLGLQPGGNTSMELPRGWAKWEGRVPAARGERNERSGEEGF